MSKLTERVIQLSKEKGITHVGSNVSAVDIIGDIYREKQPEDRFVLSQGHAGLALYVALEEFEGRNIDELLETNGTHPDKRENGVDCATGSLGCGLPIAVGMAMADRTKKVYCLISDGECAEGSIWESLRLKADQGIDNLKVHVNANGWSALGSVDRDKLEERLKVFDPDIKFHRTNSDVEKLTGLDAHYLKI